VTTELKIFYVTRNDRYDYDEFDSAVVVAESPEKAIELLKLENKYDPKELWQTWGHYNVTVEEVLPTEPKIVIQSFNAG